MRQHNFDKKRVMNDLIRAFAEQIFVTGFIHCDPHPGNVFIRPHPKDPQQHQLVILDFGLCLEIS
jgi:aarF domain-containing kinase